MKKVLIITFIFYTTCAPVKNINTYSKDELIFKSDSLMLDFPNDSDLIQSIISAKIDFARDNEDISVYKEILILDPKNPVAQYHTLMDAGFNYHKKDYKNGQWDAIESFSKAATYIDTLGEPYYWIGQAYEKKDEMDFELPLESYNKSLELYLNQEMREKVILSKQKLLNRKKTYKDFWK